MRVRYYGHVGQPSGYGDAGNEFCMALLEAGVELEISTTGDRLNQRYEALAGRIKDERDLTPNPDVVIVHTLPLTCGAFRRTIRKEVPSARFIAYTTWEGAEVAPAAVVAALADYDRVWVPSRSTANTMLHGGLGKVDVVPHAFDEALNGIAEHPCPKCSAHHALDAFQIEEAVVSPKGPATVLEWTQYGQAMNVRVDLGPDAGGLRENFYPCELARTPSGRPFRFYYIGAWNVRKNPEGLIRAYARAFRPSDAVELVIQAGDVSPDSVRMAVMATGLDDSEMPTVRFRCDRMSDAEIRQMHRGGDCFVSASRGESWNLPAFDAMLAGRHVIAPSGLGSDAYLLPTSAALYDSRPAPATGEVRIVAPAAGQPGMFRAQYIGTQGLTVRQDWREPDLIQLGICMRRAYLQRIRDLHVPYNPSEHFGRRAVARQLRTLLGDPCPTTS